MRFSNPTVRHSSTKNFRRDGNLRTQFFPEHDSEPQAPRLSSVKDVTATNAVQTHREFSPHLKRYKQSWLRPQRQSQSKTADGNQKLRTENRELGTEKGSGLPWMPLPRLSAISSRISSRFIVHFARPRVWPLASQIGSGAWRIWLSSGKPTSSGGRKERRK